MTSSERLHVRRMPAVLTAWCSALLWMMMSSHFALNRGESWGWDDALIEAFAGGVVGLGLAWAQQRQDRTDAAALGTEDLQRIKRALRTGQPDTDPRLRETQLRRAERAYGLLGPWTPLVVGLLGLALAVYMVLTTAHLTPLFLMAATAWAFSLGAGAALKWHRTDYPTLRHLIASLSAESPPR